MSAAPATAPARRAARRSGPPTARSARPSPRRGPLRVVRPAARHRRRATPFVVLSGLLIGSVVVGIVTLQALVSQTSFRMQDLQAHNRALQQDYGARTLSVARLTAPDRIAAAARRAGLVLPDPSQLYTLHVGGPQGSTEAPAGSFSAPGSSALKAVLGARP